MQFIWFSVIFRRTLCIDAHQQEPERQEYRAPGQRYIHALNWVKHVVIADRGKLSTEMALPFDQFKFIGGNIVQVKKKKKRRA